jgi:hypothetical protein
MAGKKMLRVGVNDLIHILNGKLSLNDMLPLDCAIIDARFDGFTQCVELLLTSNEFLPGSHKDPNPLLDAKLKLARLDD